MLGNGFLSHVPKLADIAVGCSTKKKGQAGGERFRAVLVPAKSHGAKVETDTAKNSAK